MLNTYLDAVNYVLLRLREPRVTNIAESDYSQLIGTFVEQAKSEVANAWDWLDLRTTIQLSTVDGTFDYVLPGAGRNFNVLQVHEDTLDYDLKKAPSYQWMNTALLVNDPQFAAPEYWDWNGRDSNGDPVVNLYPVPDKPYLINFNMKIVDPLNVEADLLQVAPLAVVLRAYQLAVEERGDDAGVSAASIGAQASSAIADAISFDANMYQAETTWYPV